MEPNWLAMADERRARINDFLSKSLARVQSAPATLLEAMHYGLLAPGKRVRPLLCSFACEAVGGNWVEAVPAGAAVEMVHAYSLIHDDLPAMDDDDLRRGRPTVHKRFGEALAILTGDALLTLAFQTLAEEYSSTVGAGCCLELARAAGACGMVGGQVDDLMWEGKVAGPARVPTVEALQTIHAAKTGALFRACLRMGWLVARGTERDDDLFPELQALDEYSHCFGLVFQITDDLLDVEGDVVTTGKRVGKDAARGKLTYPGLLGTASSREQASRLAEQARMAIRCLGEAGAGLAWMIDMLLTRRQ